jgi:predicted AlkP superfamily pyrophosphatase or phosphodiesterase
LVIARSNCVRVILLVLFVVTPFCNAATTSKPLPPVLMISVDGMRPDYITQADSHGLKVPVLRGFMQRGMYAEGVIGVVPTVTFSSHATLVTGVWPKSHGIYNNTLFDPMNKTKGSWYWFEPEFKVPTLWEAAKKAGISTASVFWPTTTNASDINFLVPAYPAHGREDSNLIEALARPNGYLTMLEKQAGAFYIRDSIVDFDDYLTKLSVEIIRKSKPGFMTVHLVSLDHSEHLTGPFSPESDQAMEQLDSMVGKLVQAERANNANAIIVVVSDHGFAATHTSVNLMIPFVQAGLITLKHSKSNVPPSIASWKALLWTAGGSAFVMLKDPVDKTTLDQTRGLLETLSNDPRNGIKRILDQEQIASMGGDPHASFMIDMKSGFSVGGRLQGNILDPIPGTGNHGYLPDHPDLRSSFFAIGSGIPAHCDLGVIDMRQIAPTIAAWLNINLPDAKLPPVKCP